MDEITYPFPSFNGTTVEVWEWLSSFIPHFTVRVIFLCILELKLIYVDLRGPWISCLDEGGITLKAVKKHLFCWIVAFISIFFRCSPAFFSYSKIRYINASNANECKPNECKTTGLLSVTYCVYVSYEHAYIIFKFHNCNGVTARFVTRFNLWLRHDLWPHNASICDPARFVTKSASICDQHYTMILESKLCRGKLVFVFTLIMYTKWYNMSIYIYELWYDAYINSGARSLMLFTLIVL